MSVFKKALTLFIGNTEDISRPHLKFPSKPNKKAPDAKSTERELIAKESQIGRELFGPIPKGHQREFFCLDEKTCIWYEEYKNREGKIESITTRYEIQGDKILKVQGGSRYSYIEGAELQNVLSAIDAYYDRVMREVYGIDPTQRLMA